MGNNDALGMALGGPGGPGLGAALNSLSDPEPEFYQQGYDDDDDQYGIACGLAGNWHNKKTYIQIQNERNSRKRRDAEEDDGEDNDDDDEEKKDDRENMLRIVGGSNSEEKSWPWQTWLSLYGGPYGSSLCGGTIIAPFYVLSAAHCGPAQGITGTALIGANNRIMLEGEMVQLRQWIPHELYNKAQTFAYDFALAKLRRIGNPMAQEGRNTGKEYRPACLPQHDTCLKAYNQAVNDCHVTGWGLQHELHKSAADVLSEVDIQIISRRDCRGSDNGDAGFYKKAYLHDPTMFCAGHPKGAKDACSGDSGGPMVCRVGNEFGKKNNFQIYGVVSWGQGCGRAERPGVYSRVTTILDWLESTANVKPPCMNRDEQSGNCLDQKPQNLCIHQPAPGSNHYFAVNENTNAMNENSEDGSFGEEWRTKFPAPPPRPLMQWYNEYIDEENVKRYNLLSEGYNYETGVHEDSGTFISYKQAFGSRYKKRYPKDANSLWSFGASSKGVENALKEGNDAKCKIVLGRTALATVKRQPCGTSDFMEFFDGTGKLVKKVCVIKKSVEIAGQCPMYVNFYSNDDPKVGKPVAFKWAVVSQEKNCGMKEAYIVDTYQWQQNIGTHQYWKNNGKSVASTGGKKKRGRKKKSSSATQIKNDAECNTIVYTPDREHWIECDTNVGARNHGYNIPRSVNCENHYISIHDGESGSDGVTKAVVCGRSTSQRMVFRTSGNFMSIHMKIGTLNSKERVSNAFGGFNLRCRAIRWATWFGADKDQCKDKSKDCNTMDTSDWRSTSAEHCDPDVEDCDTKEECRRLAMDGINGENCADYMDDDYY